MRLSDEEKAVLAGELGEPRRWAISHQIAVGEFFDAADLVQVSQAHVMADTESLGEAGVRFLEGLAAAPEAERRVRVPTITDPRGLDFAVYRRLGQTPEMAALEQRAIEALRAFGVLMTDTCINYQTIMAPSVKRGSPSRSHASGCRNLPTGSGSPSWRRSPIPLSFPPPLPRPSGSNFLPAPSQRSMLPRR